MSANTDSCSSLGAGGAGVLGTRSPEAQPAQKKPAMYIYKVLKQVAWGPPWAWGGGWRKPGKGLDGAHSCTKGPAPLLWGHSSFQRPRRGRSIVYPEPAVGQEAVQTCSHPGPEATGLWDR